jgi:hypothetical protein
MAREVPTSAGRIVPMTGDCRRSTRNVSAASGRNGVTLARIGWALSEGRTARDTGSTQTPKNFSAMSKCMDTLSNLGTAAAVRMLELMFRDELKLICRLPLTQLDRLWAHRWVSEGHVDWLATAGVTRQTALSVLSRGDL